MHDESLEPRAYAKLHADRYLWQEQQERAAANLFAVRRALDESLRLAVAVIALGGIGGALGFLAFVVITKTARHAGWIG
jgi:hypothetical protein